MWPRRKIQLVASPETVGIEGVRALLKGIQADFFETEPTSEDRSKEITNRWLEKPLHDFSAAAEPEELGLLTELVYWPETSEHDFWRKAADSRGMTQQSIQALLHNILADEHILKVTEPTVLVKGRPLLGHILKVAGFEPTILWPSEDGKWGCERGQGLHWILPESWLVGLTGTNSLGRETKQGEKVTWVVRETQIDFYRTPDHLRYIGSLPRWEVRMEEESAAQTLAICLDLGVSWFDIKLALSSIGKNITITDNLRWNTDDFGRNAGTSGEELPAAPIDHVEDWWAC